MPVQLQAYDNPDAVQQAHIAALLQQPGVTQAINGTTITLTVPDPRPLADQIATVFGNIQLSILARLNGGFVFQGHPFQSDPLSLSWIQSSGAAAQAAIANGSGTAGNLRWADPNVDFVWIDTNNATLAMDAPTMLQFFLTTVKLGQAIILNGRALKDRALAATDAPTLDAIDITAGWPVQS